MTFSKKDTEWVIFNFTAESWEWNGLPWNAIFAVVCWMLWKNRNAWVFQQSNSALSLEIIQHQISELSRFMVPTHAHPSRKDQLFISWHPPVADWIKLNTDGAVKGTSYEASCGGVLRDASGVWCGGFVANLGTTSVISAELWGLYHGLHLAWLKGVKKLVVEMDSKVALQLIHLPVSASSPLSPLILACQVLIARDWIVQMHHIYREGNRVADKLAGCGASYPLGVHILERVPAAIHSEVWDDLCGIAMPRLVPHVSMIQGTVY